MDIGRAITYVTQDPRWITKLVVAAAIFAAGGLFFPVGWMLTGFQLETIRRVYRGSDVPLPEWDNIGSYFVQGLLVTVGIGIWFLPVGMLFACVVAAAAAVDTTGTSALLSLCLLVPLSLAFLFVVVPVIVAKYAVEGEFSSMFAFGEIAAEVRLAPGQMALVGLMSALVLMVASIAGLLACLIGTLVTIPYAYLVMAHLLGQAYRSARPLAPAPQAAIAAF